MEKAAFNFKGYHFKKAIIDFPTGNDFYDLQIAFNPSGVFDTQNSLYKLLLEIVVLTGEENNEHPIVDVTCEAEFQFSQKIELNDIPGFFYPNSIAILFPYIRAFVSTLTLQANVTPIVLPTLNLTNLQEKLKKNTTSF